MSKKRGETQQSRGTKGRCVKTQTIVLAPAVKTTCWVTRLCVGDRHGATEGHGLEISGQAFQPHRPVGGRRALSLGVCRMHRRRQLATLCPRCNWRPHAASACSLSTCTPPWQRGHVEPRKCVSIHCGGWRACSRSFWHACRRPTRTFASGYGLRLPLCPRGALPHTGCTQ